MTAQPRRIAFARIAAAALGHADTLAGRWLPDGRREGAEWVAINPNRVDKRKGSFKVNLRTGRCSDFATGDKRGDLTALAAYLFNLDQAEAARKIAAALGIDRPAQPWMRGGIRGDACRSSHRDQHHCPGADT
jgi:hypothetical protein